MCVRGPIVRTNDFAPRPPFRAPVYIPERQQGFGPEAIPESFTRTPSRVPVVAFPPLARQRPGSFFWGYGSAKRDGTLPSMRHDPEPRHGGEGTRSPLTVAVLARDERRNLARCLRSVAWAAERLVLDTGSVDETIAIADREGARVERMPWRGYVPARNRTIELATQPWVFVLDADEWVTDEGAAELRAVIAAEAHDAFSVPRRSAFCGEFVDRAWGDDRQVRIFRRELGRYGGGPVHETLELREGTRVASLRHPIEHLSYRDLDGFLDRLNRYTTLAADGLEEGRRRASLARLVASPPWAFLRTYVFRGGFRDGIRGFLVAGGAATYVLFKYAKAWERGRDRGPRLERAARPTPEDPDPAARSGPAQS